MNLGIELAERGLLPDAAVRLGIRGLNRRRLRGEHVGHPELLRAASGRFPTTFSRRGDPTDLSKEDFECRLHK